MRDLPNLQDGRNYGGWNEMDSTLSTDCDSQTATTRPKNSSGSLGKAGRSAPKSKGRSRSGRAADDTRPAGWKPAGSEVGLSILQAGFDQALDEGLTARLGHLPPSGEILHHRILIEIWGAAICPNCQAWTGQTICPACRNQIG